MFHSAWRNYLNFGSDTGGYRGGARTKELFIRWTQMSAFCPLMENGGNNEHRPWMYDNETLQIYANFVDIHMELNPYFLSIGNEAYQQGVSVMHPQARDTIFTPDSWDFTLGNDDILVCPIVDNSTSKRLVTFPKGNDWVDWWSNATYAGGSEHTFDVPLDELPLFRKKGSILPLKVSKAFHGGQGDHYFADSLTLLVESPLDGLHSRHVYEWQGSGLHFQYEHSSTLRLLQMRCTQYDGDVILMIRGLPKEWHETVEVQDEHVQAPLKQLRSTPGSKSECSRSIRLAARTAATQSTGVWCWQHSETAPALLIRPGNTLRKGMHLLVKA